MAAPHPTPYTLFPVPYTLFPVPYYLLLITYYLLLKMFISHSDSTKIQKIHRAVHSDISIDRLMELCEEISQQIKDPDFSFTYAGVILACQNRISEAIAFFERCPDRAFCRALAEYLLETGTFTPPTQAYQETSPYDVFTKTNFYRSHLKATLEIFKDFAIQNPPPSSSPTIVDIGTGNGVLISKIVNQLVQVYSLERIHLICIDQSPKMLAAASKCCQDSISIPVQITSIENLIQNLSQDQLSEIMRCSENIWFINGSFSLHHMPESMKIKAFKTLSKIQAKILLSEGHGNHDKPEKDSPELVASVSDFYGFFIEDIANSISSATEQKICIQEMMLTDAITMLKNDWEHRIDYQNLITEWEKIAEIAGFEVVKTTPTVYHQERPLTFMMELQPTRSLVKKDAQE